MEPPRPPSPPSGPPRGTCASRRNVAAPSPPLPALTKIETRSRNIAGLSRQEDRGAAAASPALLQAGDATGVRTAASRGVGAIDLGRGSEIRKRIDARAAVPDRAAPDLEVEVRTGRVARHPDPAHLLATGHGLPATDGD